MKPIKYPYPHREHRSKKNRRTVPSWERIKDWKRKREELRIKELENYERDIN